MPLPTVQTQQSGGEGVCPPVEIHLIDRSLKVVRERVEHNQSMNLLSYVRGEEERRGGEKKRGERRFVLPSALLGL